MSGLEVGGQLGDQIAEPVHLGGGTGGGDDGWRVDLHGDFPPVAPTLHPGFGASWERRGRAIPGRGIISGRSLSSRPASGACGALDGHRPSVASGPRCPSGGAVKRKLRLGRGRSEILINLPGTGRDGRVRGELPTDTGLLQPGRDG